MDEIRCGLLRDDEVEALAALAARIWHAHYPGIIPVEQIDYMLAQRYKPALIRQTLARGDRWEVARVAAAETGHQLAGFAHGFDLGNGDYKLDKLYVDTDLQRHGIGGLLIERMVEQARRHACQRLVLRVNRQNQAAINAYLKHGFQVVTVVLEEIGGGFVMDDYVMARGL